MSRTFVVAEAGSSHDGDPWKMRELIRVAKAAGADACKFQWCSSPERLAARRHAEDYLDAYRTIAFPVSTLLWLKALCDEAEIEFMCTVFLPEDIQEIAPLIKRFKIASFEARDGEFVKAHCPYGKPILLSTGMVSRDERFALHVCPGIRMLHCVSSYPAPADEMNLSVLRLRPRADGRAYVGLSDHSGHLWMGALAVAAGGEILEVHFRLLSTFVTNPDYPHSLDPSQLAQYIANVRFAEEAMGNGVKRLMPSEARWARYRVAP